MKRYLQFAFGMPLVNLLSQRKERKEEKKRVSVLGARRHKGAKNLWKLYLNFFYIDASSIKTLENIKALETGLILKISLIKQHQVMILQVSFLIKKNLEKWAATYMFYFLLIII